MSDDSETMAGSLARAIFAGLERAERERAAPAPAPAPPAKRQPEERPAAPTSIYDAPAAFIEE